MICMMVIGDMTICTGKREDEAVLVWIGIAVMVI